MPVGCRAVITLQLNDFPYYSRIKLTDIDGNIYSNLSVKPENADKIRNAMAQGGNHLIKVLHQLQATQSFAQKIEEINNDAVKSDTVNELVSGT